MIREDCSDTSISFIVESSTGWPEVGNAVIDSSKAVLGCEGLIPWYVSIGANVGDSSVMQAFAGLEDPGLCRGELSGESCASVTSACSVSSLGWSVYLAVAHEEEVVVPSWPWVFLADGRIKKAVSFRGQRASFLFLDIASGWEEVAVIGRLCRRCG